MAEKKMSAKGNEIPGDLDLFHDGTTAYDSTKSASFASGAADDLEATYHACIVWDDAATMDQVMGAIERIKGALAEKGMKTAGTVIGL